MDTKQRHKIRDTAKLIQEFSTIGDTLIDIAEQLEPKKKKQLIAIAKLIEKIPNSLFDSSSAKSLQLYELLNKGYTQEELATKIGESPETVNQRLNALKAGGIKLNVRKFITTIL